MVALGVRRTAGAGGRRYVIDGDGGALPMEPVRRLVEAVDCNAVMVVVRTKAGAASPVARALDEARLARPAGDGGRRRYRAGGAGGGSRRQRAGAPAAAPAGRDLTRRNCAAPSV